MSVGQVRLGQRLASTTVGVLVFAALGALAAKQFLYGDQILVQTFTFQIESNGTKAALRWKEFLAAQEDRLGTLWGQAPESSAAELSVASDKNADASVGRITVRLRHHTGAENVAGAFAEVVSAYTRHRETLEKSWSLQSNARGTATANGSNGAVLDSWIKQRTDRYDQLQEKLTTLDTEYNRLSAESISLERRLAGKTVQSTSAAFGQFVKPQIDSSWAADTQLNQMVEQAAQLLQQKADLDLQAGRSTSRENLAQIDRRRESLNQQDQQLQLNTTRRRRLISDQVKDRLWPDYQDLLRSQVAARHQDMIRISAERQAVIATLQRIANDMAFFRDKVSSENGQNHISPRHNVRTTALHARLQRPVAQWQLESAWSRLQQALIVLLALAGGGLGLLIPSLARRRQGTQNASEDTSPPDDQVAQQPQTVRPESAGPEAIDVTADLPPAPAGTPGNGTTGWAGQYDRLADTVEPLTNHTKCAVVIITSIARAHMSPRLAVNLAIALKRRGLRVLLVEADQDKHDLASIFETPPTPGFFEWRRGEAWVSQVATQTQLAGLSFMPAGQASDEQLSDELDLDKELHRWGNLSNNFDVVLLYIPDVLPQAPPAEPTAMQALLDVADGVFVLTAAGTDFAAEDRRVRAALDQRKARFLGPVPVKK